jgi:hypothetical protein
LLDAIDREDAFQADVIQALMSLFLPAGGARVLPFPVGLVALMFRRSIIAVSLLSIAACDAAPTGPSATLTLSQVSLTLSRNSTETVKALLAASDVSAAALWSSSDTAVVTADGGVLRAVGLGGARVTASYRERIATMEVTVRRNTAIGGVFAMREVAGRESFGCVTVSIEAKVIGGRCGSDHLASVRQEALLGRLSAIRDPFTVTPGPLTLTVSVALHEFVGESSRRLAIEDLSNIEFFDADTGESLERASLPVREIVVSRVGSFTLPVTVKTYTQ